MSRKLISYSLFKGNDPLAEIFYVRGFYFNVLMNSLVYPSWQTVVYIDEYMSKKYRSIFQKLAIEYGIGTHQRFNGESDKHCAKMLERMRPIFWEDVDYVICRDSDALTSYREAQAVDEWLSFLYTVHSIHDNDAHNTPIMGGLCGFVAGAIRSKYESFEKMLALSPVAIDDHGSDQDFLTRVVYEDFKEQMMLHNFKGEKSHCAAAMNDSWLDQIPGVDKRLWVSNLCTSFIGAAGFNEMETLRFLRDYSHNFSKDFSLSDSHPKIFYWI